jgi:peptidyl-prolyl cis-trans isomerase C
MTFLRSLCLLLPAASLLAQTFTLPGGGQPSVTSNATPPDKVIIAVDDIKITAADFDRIVASMPQQYQAQARGPSRSQFANNMVQMFVLAQQGRREKLDQDAQFQMLLKFQADNMLASTVASELSKANQPDEAALRKYYDDHKADFQQATMSHILVRFQGSQATVRPGQKDLTEAEALAKIQSLRQRIEGGEDFAKVAMAESDDVGSGAKGGDLGVVTHGMTVPAFEEAAFALKPGEMSQPVKTQFGFHLIKLVSSDVKPYDSVRPEIVRLLAPPLLQNAIEGLMKKATVTLDPDYFPPTPAAK